MSTYIIRFHDKIRIFPQIFVFLSYRKNFVGTQNEFESAMINEPSILELLKVHYRYEIDSLGQIDR